MQPLLGVLGSVCEATAQPLGPRRSPGSFFERGLKGLQI